MENNYYLFEDHQSICGILNLQINNKKVEENTLILL